MIDFTPIARKVFAGKARRVEAWADGCGQIQLAQLRRLLRQGAPTEYGRRYRFDEILAAADAGGDLVGEYRRRVPLVEYEEIRPLVMRMIAGERDVLWPGLCRNFAQSSGTSGGKSKYIPVTDESLRQNHYAGAGDSVAFYLRHVPECRMFAGKGLILGGSFANEIPPGEVAKGTKIGDLSATLIDRIPFGAGLFRVPDKRTALLSDWSVKLPRIAEKSLHEDITNISGVPSWFLTVIRKVLELSGKERITDVWPNLEVFFHGGISFEPYREEYMQLCGPGVRFMETYNASEGFFACAERPGERGMLLLIDEGVFYEFIPVTGGEAVSAGDVTPGKVYELVISGTNGLWRYRLGDTVRIESVRPMKITIAGRTKSFINAFGEEVMEYNADAAISAACAATDAQIANYTVAPVFARDGRKGRHQWIIEWVKEPADMEAFARTLDEHLQQENSDYQAKRSHTIFLDPPLVTTAPAGTFDRWLARNGNGKLGGQRKIPRLSNDRRIADSLGL